MNVCLDLHGDVFILDEIDISKIFKNGILMSYCYINSLGWEISLQTNARRPAY
jgi:hypothetical protein